MIFKGTGIVRRRGRVIANFVDGVFVSDDPSVIYHLLQLGFTETSEAPAVETANPVPRVFSHAKPKKVR